MEIAKDGPPKKKIGLSGKAFGGQKTSVETLVEALEKTVRGSSKDPKLLHVLAEDNEDKKGKR